MTAAELDAHARSLAHENRVLVDTRNGSRGAARRRDRLIRIPPIRGQVSYLVALHEIGHVAVKPEPPLRLGQEVAAWRWALANSLVEPSAASYRAIASRLGTYEQRAHRWGGMKVPPEFPQLLEEMRAAGGAS
jgi:hypothetical protein